MTTSTPTPQPTRVVLAIDLGTTQAKAGLVTLDGRLLTEARGAYPILPVTERGAAEQDPAAWWTVIVTMSAALLATAGAVEIVAVCADGQGPTLVVADADGRSVGPALTWLDTRCSADESSMTAATGAYGWTLGVLPRARWFERQRPALAAHGRWYLASWEWVALRLSGVACRTSLSAQVHPDLDLVAATGLRTDRVPPLVAAGTVIGRLLAGPAAELGLPPGIPVVAGMADAHASFLGAGLLEPGDAIDTGGTSGGFAVYTDRPLDIPGVFGAAAPIPGRWFLGGAMNATGKALEWFRDDVLTGESSIDDLLAEAAMLAAGADGLVFLPYLAGERSPIWDATARGAFVGLTLRHRRAHLVRSIVEAANLALRHVAAPIVAAGVPVTELRVSGGLARDAAWNRVKADVTGFAVAVPEVLETALLGSAITAATGIGWCADFATGARTMVRIRERIEPDPAKRQIYDSLYAVYAELYPALRLAFQGLAAIERDSAGGIEDPG